MPGWYEQLKPHLQSGKIVMLGVIQEQHADRCRLFKQWKHLDFPVVQDQLNTNGIDVVPVYIAIDEQGVVRSRPRRFADFESDFLNQDFDKPAQQPAVVTQEVAQLEYWKQRLKEERSFDNLVRLADAKTIWQPTKEGVAEACRHYQEAIDQRPDRADVRFRWAAASRLLYELGGQTDVELFQRSVDQWETALRLNPNQYIYRRRIEQYGPRLKKPYSFYDWVEIARKEISQRGETPIELSVEPNGAELADRAKAMPVEQAADNPDPDGKVTRDSGQWVSFHATTVPSHPKPGDVVAVHLNFQVDGDAKWNHEATPMEAWIEPADECDAAQLSRQRVVDQAPHPQPESVSPVSLALEIKIPEGRKGPVKLKGFALFHACETAGGQCVFRRRDFSVSIPVSPN